MEENGIGGDTVAYEFNTVSGRHLPRSTAWMGGSFFTHNERHMAKGATDKGRMEGNVKWR